jgi:asparagine synthase (glutamine-hydrolysing)
VVGAADVDVVPWFVVLPDCESADAAGTLFRRRATREITHQSGRPWIVGRFAPDAVTTGQAGTTKIAVIGQRAITPGELSDAADDVRTVADLDRLAGSLVGSVHLIASVAGRVRVQGSVTGVRRVFHARVGAAAVAADRADVLARALGAGLDEPRLALGLLEPPILYPLAGQPVWRGVAVLPTDHYLLLDGERERSVRWWAPPEPVVPIRQGAAALRDALCAAVDARVRRGGLVSSDLGGLDSTAICCVAARDGATVVAYTVECWDPQADDARWAARTVAGLSHLEHHVIPAQEMPLSYDRIFDMDDRLDEPYVAAVDRGRQLAVVRRAVARGSRVHLTGFGGDELLYGSPAHLHSLVRTNPRVAWWHLRGFATKCRWPRREMLRQLADRGPYRAWLTRVADHLTDAPEPWETPLLSWGWEPRLPPWTTPAGVEAVRELVRSAAAAAEPLAEERGQHRELETMRYISRIARHDEQMAARKGTVFACPYYDDRVVEAGLGVRSEDRITPWRYKPLIIEAMRGIVPEASLARQTKANASYEEEAGLREHRADLLAMCDESRLGRLGLIDAAALREAVSRPLPRELQNSGLHQTVACEVWLRALEAGTSGVRSEAGAAAA